MRVIIVDDEPLARERIRTLATGHPDVTVLAECEDGAAAVETVERLKPDLVFLDVQMPELDGFEVLDALETRPAIIFVTAYDEHAVRAFEVNAIDYLLKPVEPARFDAALERARTRMQGPDRSADSALELVLSELRRVRQRPARLVIRDGAKVGFVAVDQVDWIDVSGNYARLHTAKGVHLLRETLKQLEHRLDPERFVRVHRSIIVNLERITAVEPYFHGEYTLTLKDGTRLTSSRTHSARLRALLR
jgi:two-component system, LytTR family, response regulator